MGSYMDKFKIFLKSLSVTWYQFATRTSIHGIKFIVDPNGHIFTRCLWIGITLACFITANTLVNEFYIRYKSNPTRMNVETNFGPVAQVPYPAVTLCSTNYISIKKTRTFVGNLTLPGNLTAADFIPFFEQTIGFSHRTEYKSAELNIIQEVLVLNRYDIATTMKSLRITCRDLIIRCRFEGVFIDCMKLFRVSGTYNGFCCSFNLADFSKDDYIPYKPKQFGLGNGLSVILQPNIDADSVSKIHSDGVQLLIQDGENFPSDTSIEKILPFQYETLVSLRPTVTFCSTQVKQLPISARQCVFSGEVQLEHFKGYKEVNCDVECRIKRTFDQCECIPFYYPNIYNIPVCNFTKIACLLDHYYELHESHKNQTSTITCDCPANCNGIYYDVHTDTAKINVSNFTYDPFYKGINSSHMIVHVFMDSQVYKRMRRDLLVNVIGLISNFGGAYSLFLGMSVIGLLEILYFVFIRLIRNYHIISDAEERLMESSEFNSRASTAKANTKIPKFKDEIIGHM